MIFEQFAREGIYKPKSAVLKQVVGDADGVGDDGVGWVDCSARGEQAGVDDIEIVEVMGLAVDVEDGGLRVGAEATGPDTFEGDTFFELGVEGDGTFGMAGLFSTSIQRPFRRVKDSTLSV